MISSIARKRLTHSVSSCTVCTSAMPVMASLRASVPSAVLALKLGVTMSVSGSGLSFNASSALPNPEFSRKSLRACSALMTRTAATSSLCRSCFATAATRAVFAFLSM